MPCSYYAPGEEARIAAQDAETRSKKYRDDLTKLTLEADMLRDLVIEFLDGHTPDVPKELKAKIKRAQVKHRKIDLERLEKVFTDKRDVDRLAKVWEADPKSPLEPQLGFNPDDF